MKSDAWQPKPRKDPLGVGLQTKRREAEAEANTIKRKRLLLISTLLGSAAAASTLMFIAFAVMGPH
ncbi:hypothetical protein [Caulobacter rhizosphaerae]|jgi:hypothetical protein|uniref:hypothetical protein n=1 Tax=Caulobacter rhizosphaerae TaxID=2010972 RepID=UPI0013D3C5EB|nr:hypothetical protein [Caulobacter rhizosphaerae]GGL49646.1 hypothetical protein GCM10010983_53820 [Caulobacter rhizosphaerae]